MTKEIFRCFIASPGDTTPERDACDEVFEEINSGIGELHNFRIETVKWEKDTYPGFGSDLQDVVNEQLEPGSHPFFIGIMWQRFGTETPRAGSGTEEEFDQAYEQWLKDKTKNIQFYFNNESPESLQSIDIDQYAKVSKLSLIHI